MICGLRFRGKEASKKVKRESVGREKQDGLFAAEVDRQQGTRRISGGENRAEQERRVEENSSGDIRTIE